MTLSRFQQLASRRFGWSAKKTLNIAQSLYDKELTSYPRTPCMVLPNEQEAEIPVCWKRSPRCQDWRGTWQH